MDFRLPWTEYDPRRRTPLDLEGARKAIARALWRRGRTGAARERAERELHFQVWSELGAWSEGWHDPIGEGGTNRVWEGAASVGDSDEVTISRVLRAL